MFNIKQISKKLNDENYFITQQVLINFIKAWHIEVIWENEEGEEFFDEFSIEKIKKGISLKSQGFSNDQIIYKLSKFTTTEEIKADLDVEKTVKSTNESHFGEVIPMETTEKNSEIITKADKQHRTLTVDITSQTLQMIAEAVAGKITSDIKSQFESADFKEQLIEAGYFKKDNEILSSQMQKLIEDNKNLAQRVKDLESKKTFWQKLLS